MVTVNRATRLVIVLLAAVAIRRKSVPESASASVGVVKLLLVAPGILVKVNPPGARACHWKVDRAGSLTTPENVVVVPANATVSAGSWLKEIGPVNGIVSMATSS